MFKKFNAYLDLLSYIEWYGYYGEGIDTRINWDTHIVMWGHTVIGFLSGPLDN